MIKIAVYGKGGIGKSTVTGNLAIPKAGCSRISAAGPPHLQVLGKELYK